MDHRIERMARLLAAYSLDICKGDRVLINSDLAAMPLVRAFYREVVQRGGHPEILVEDQYCYETLLKEGTDEQLLATSPAYHRAVETAQAYLTIWGNNNTRYLSNVDPERIQMVRKGRKEVEKLFMEREGRKEIRWCGTQFPTEAGAQEANMSLSDYEDFCYSACLIDRDDPVTEWWDVKREQDRVCKMLEGKRTIRIVAEDTDLSMDVTSRPWVRCAGQANMPDGEVFTSPIEDSLNGHIRFSFPGIEMGREIEDIRLWFERGKVVKAKAAKGQDLLEQLLRTDPGACYAGELGIGTNYGIKRFTRNMLFDEKIGGTVHVAVGRGFPESGGKNFSVIHWDMLCDMRNGGELIADGEVIYRDGRFIV
jgi:aminopeptidase